MKKTAKYFTIFLFLFSSFLYSQSVNHSKHKEFMGRIEQLEKIKLIEELNLSEDVAIKFFARRNSNKLEQKELVKKKNKLYEELKSFVNDNSGDNIDTTIDKIMKIEGSILEKRKEFINSLNDIFTKKQIAQLLLFELNFRKEMRHQFIKQGMRRMMLDK